MSTDIASLQEQRQKAKEESQRLVRSLKRKRRELVCLTRRSKEDKARRRGVGLRILAIAPDSTVSLQQFLKTELSAESQECIDLEHEDIVAEFLAISFEAVSALVEPIAAEATTELQAAVDFAVKSELHSWTSLQNLSKGVLPTGDPA